MARAPNVITQNDMKILMSQIRGTQMAREDLYKEILRLRKQLKNFIDQFNTYSELLNKLWARYNDAQKLVNTSHPRDCNCVEHDLLRNLIKAG